MDFLWTQMMQDRMLSISNGSWSDEQWRVCKIMVKFLVIKQDVSDIACFE